MKLETLKDATNATNQFLETLKEEGFVLDSQIVAQGNRAEAKLHLRPMTAQEHKHYLATKPPKIEKSKGTDRPKTD